MACVLGREIGRGTYGKIYTTSNPSYVIKTYIKDPASDTEIESTAEIDILFRMRSPYIVEGAHIYPPGDCGKDMAISIERLLNQAVVLAKSNTAYPILKRLTHDYCLGLACLHDHKYLHLDISRNNALYGGTPDNPIGKLIDFGLAVAAQTDAKGNILPIRTEHLRVTADFRPLENFTDLKTYSDKSDVWSLGVLILEILSRKNLIDFSLNPVYIIDAMGQKHFDYDTVCKAQFTAFTQPAKINENIRARLGPVPAKEQDALVDLLANMLQVDVARRWDMQRVVMSAFYADLKVPPGICNDTNVKPVAPEVKFDAARYQGLETILRHAVNYFRDLPAEFIFTAFDVYMRLIGGVGPLATPADIRNVAFIAMFIAYRLFEASTELPKMYKGLPAWGLEGMTLKFLEGIIRRPYFFDRCRSIAELMRVFVDFFANSDLEPLDGYLRVDLDGYFDILRRIPMPSLTYPEPFTVGVFYNMYIPPSPDDVNLAYKYLNELPMNAMFKGIEITPQVLFTALDLFLQLIISPGGPNGYNELKSVSQDVVVRDINYIVGPKLQRVTLAIFGVAYETVTGKTLDKVPEFKDLRGLMDDIRKVPGIQVRDILYPSTESNDEARLLYRLLYLDGAPQYTIYDTYMNVAQNLNTYLQGLRQDYNIRPGPKNGTISNLLLQALPPKRSRATT